MTGGMTGGMTGEADWVIWNGSLGILDMAAIGRTEKDGSGQSAFLAPPYDAVGPFNLDELERQGWITFGACLVMSRLRWQEDQVKLRKEAQAQRRAFYARMDFSEDGDEHREVLELPLEGVLEAAQINSAFRRLAKTAHPDAGGSSEQYRRISEARDALLELFGAG